MSASKLQSLEGRRPMSHRVTEVKHASKLPTAQRPIRGLKPGTRSKLAAQAQL